jgi:hypothetical protein
MPKMRSRWRRNTHMFMYIVKSNKGPSEGCDTSRVNHCKKWYMMEKEEINSHWIVCDMCNSSYQGNVVSGSPYDWSPQDNIWDNRAIISFIYNILLIYLDLHVPIFFLFFILLGPSCVQLFLAPCLSSQKGRKGIYEGDSSNLWSATSL